MANPELNPPPRKNARSKKPVAAVTPAELALMKKHQIDVQDVPPSPRKISPFADGYDLDAEGMAVAHLLAVDEPSPRDPLYARYEEYLDRVRALEKMRQSHATRAQGNSDVPLEQGMKLRRIGALTSRDEDTMTVHTLEACRLYTGVSPEPGSESRFGVPGARRAANALRQLFLLSGNDNPVADLKLIETDERLAEIRKLIASQEKLHADKLNERRNRGLSYSILQSKSPQVFSLGYHSPYGYAVGDVCVGFDYCVRVIKSASRRDLVSRQEEHAALHRMKREIRSMFENAITASRLLMSPALLGLCRSDYLPQSSEVSKKRVEAAKAIFGVLPQEVFIGTKTSRHSLRNQRLTSKDVELLRQISVQDLGDDGDQAISAAAASNLI
jgi:integrating conjugative element protein (TIGR03761 family)